MSPLIDAHRGECGTPGLTAAERYIRAISMGVEYVEIDVRRTSDRVYVNYHDDRTASGHEVRALTLSALNQELGAQLLTVDEVIELVDGKVGLHVDLKEGGEELEVVRYIEARCAHSEVVFTTGGDDAVRAIKDQIPQARAGLTLGEDLEGAPPWRAVRVRLSELFPGPRLRRSRADFTAVHKRLAGVRVLDYCARKRMPAWVWTVDDEVEIARFMRDPRLTVLITNRPDIALRFRKA
ncbi:MAG: glycerophosphodiester phosphodiesterase [Chloroflexi bacterium]|nr:MAG: glycerophosphodiester phosphodiesterase [Chloroflexota bacterium]